MCGIAGFWGLGSQRDIDRMTDALAHRGPDGRGVWAMPDGRGFLGHRRLSIVDLEGGYQPMPSADGRLHITFNGEIYNHTALRRQLAGLGHRFQTSHSDTEVILAGYREWGASVQDRLRGMWAFAIYDADEQLLFCSRDRFGEKPFYYTTRNGFFAFASEASSLIQHEKISAHVSDDALIKYLAYGYLPAPQSIYAGMRKLPAGHSLTYRWAVDQTDVRAYWDASLTKQEISPDQAQEGLTAHLERSIQERLQADVPVGVFLSGGIDSSLVAAFAHRVSSTPVSAYTVGFEESAFDETEHAARVARQLELDHHVDTLSLEKSLELLPDLIEHLDEPMADSSILPTSLVSQSARQSVKVILGGDGADELFGGYNPFRHIRKINRLAHLPGGIKAAADNLASLGPWSTPQDRVSKLDLLRRLLRSARYPEAIRLPLWLGPSLDLAALGELFGRRLDMEEVYSEAFAHFETCAHLPDEDRLTYLYLKLYLQDDILAKVDRASMKYGLEVRSPFLDHELAEFAFSLPWSVKMPSGRTKGLLKDLLEKTLPGSETQRPKQGFRLPVAQWFQHEKLTFNPAAFPAMKTQFIAKRLESHRSRKSDERTFLWALYLLSNWGLRS